MHVNKFKIINYTSLMNFTPTEFYVFFFLIGQSCCQFILCLYILLLARRYYELTEPVILFVLYFLCIPKKINVIFLELSMFYYILNFEKNRVSLAKIYKIVYDTSLMHIHV